MAANKGGQRMLGIIEEKPHNNVQNQEVRARRKRLHQKKKKNQTKAAQIKGTTRKENTVEHVGCTHVLGCDSHTPCA